MGRLYKREGRKGYYVDYVDADGGRVRKFASMDRRTAEQILRESERKRDRIKGGLDPAVSNDRAVVEVWEAFRAHLEATGRRPRTIGYYEGLIPGLLRIVGAEKVKDLTPERAAAYVENRSAAGLSPRRINSGLTAVQTMLRWAVRRGMIGQNPLAYCDKVEGRKVKARRPLEDHEIRKLLDKSPLRYARIWRAFLGTGLRKGELIALRWRDVDIDKGLLCIRAETCKTRREDYLPLAPEVETVLREIMPGEPDPEAFVFTNSIGKPWNPRVLLRRFKTCVKHAGIDPTGLDLHSCRQTFGTTLVAAGVDVKTVQTLMRHKTITMTMDLYVRPRALKQRDAMRALDLDHRGAEKAPDAKKGAQLKTA